MTHCCATAWPAMREIVDVMRTCEDFEPVVMSLPHRFPLLQQMAGENEVHTMLAAQGYPHIRIRDAAAETALDQVRAWGLPSSSGRHRGTTTCPLA